MNYIFGSAGLMIRRPATTPGPYVLAMKLCITDNDNPISLPSGNNMSERVINCKSN